MIIYNHPEELYRSDPSACQSDMKEFLRSPAHLKARKDNPKEPTDNMILGTMLHHLVLTPDAPCKLVVRPKEMKFTTTEGKAWRDLNQHHITHEDNQKALAMAKAIKECPQAALMLGDGKPEVSVFTEFNAVGKPLKVKARIDFVHSGNALLDIKTTQDARPLAFSRTIVDFGYHIQAAWYLDAWNNESDQKKDWFCFIVVESEPPHGVKCYFLDSEAVELGRSKYVSQLPFLRDCIERDNWPGYYGDVERINLPKWSLKNEN